MASSNARWRGITAHGDCGIQTDGVDAVVGVPSSEFPEAPAMQALFLVAVLLSLHHIPAIPFQTRNRDLGSQLFTRALESTAHSA